MDTASINGLVPMIHVADVERSVEFYKCLGFAVGNRVPRGHSPMQWAWLYAPDAADWKRGPNLMLTRSSFAPAGGAEYVLFYLYASNLNSLRAELLAAGLRAGEIAYPEYLPNGEFRIEDPDGYTLMIAQSAPDTP